MKVAGLTGSIAMGKSTVAQMFARLGVPVLDSDQVVHQLYKKGGRAVADVAAAFPASHIEGAIDRKLLGKIVLADKKSLEKLESIVHPMVREIQNEFINRAAGKKHNLVILEIPLLFEVGADKWLDNTIVVSAGSKLQRARVMARPGMNREKLDAILARQIPDAEKRRRADYIIDTSKDLDTTLGEVKQLLKKLVSKE